MSYDRHLDDENKYRVKVDNGKVKITRYGEEWLTNPEGSNAWIAVADQLEKLREENEELKQLRTLAEDAVKILRELRPSANAQPFTKSYVSGFRTDELRKLYYNGSLENKFNDPHYKLNGVVFKDGSFPAIMLEDRFDGSLWTVSLDEDAPGMTQTSPF